MSRYGLCDVCKEPSILGQVAGAEGKPWLCPDCACALFRLPHERVREVKITLLEQYEKEKAETKK